MDLVKEVENSQKKSLELVRVKNKDYAGKINSFKNFDVAGDVCNISSERGILVRMVDKIVRVGNLLDKQAEVKDETIEDTLLDLANYSYILLAKIKRTNFINKK